MHVHADRGACEGYLNCTAEAPEVFDVDDDGLVVVLQDRPSGDSLPRTQAAVRACPARALRLSAD